MTQKSLSICIHSHGNDIQQTWINRDSHYKITYRVSVKRIFFLRFSVCMWQFLRGLRLNFKIFSDESRKIFSSEHSKCISICSINILDKWNDVDCKQFHLKNFHSKNIKISNLITRQHETLFSLEIPLIQITFQQESRRESSLRKIFPLEFHALQQSIKFLF